MQNFELHNPTEILIGKNQIDKINKEIPQNSKILLVYGGGSIFKSGVYDQVKNALNGFEIVEFGGVEANPVFETLMKAVEIVKTKNIGFILAVGGGSVIDGVKFIASAAAYQGERSEEHTSELQSRENLVCRLLL